MIPGGGGNPSTTLASFFKYLRKLGLMAFVLLGVVVITAIESVRNTPRKATPTHLASSAAEAKAACEMYASMKTRLDGVDRISKLIPPSELVTTARRQEFESHRVAVKRENSLRMLLGVLTRSDSAPSVPSRPIPSIHPYFGEIAIMALNDRVTLDTACRWMRDDAAYAASVRRVYQNYLEAQRANARDGHPTPQLNSASSKESDSRERRHK